MPPVPCPFTPVPWPLVVALEDCYVAELAQEVINTVRVIDNEVLCMAWELEAFLARQLAEKRRN